MSKKHTGITRRKFLQGTGLSFTWATTLPIQSSLIYGKTFDAVTIKPSVVIYNDSAHFDDTGLLDAYVPPVSFASSTKHYINRLTEQEFLTRHWFV